MDVQERRPSETAATDEATGWIEWNGGECPVDGDTQVEARNAKGWVLSAPAFVLKWDKVAAYRVVPA